MPYSIPVMEVGWPMSRVPHLQTYLLKVFLIMKLVIILDQRIIALLKVAGGVQLEAASCVGAVLLYRGSVYVPHY